MTEPNITQRLMPILAANVVGYSRLMQAMTKPLSPHWTHPDRSFKNILSGIKVESSTWLAIPF